jgi:hypothetical protein
VGANTKPTFIIIKNQTGGVCWDKLHNCSGNNMEKRVTMSQLLWQTISGEITGLSIIVVPFDVYATAINASVTQLHTSVIKHPMYFEFCNTCYLQKCWQ